MKVILLTQVPKIGKKYEIKEVSDGHALNFLIPKRLAEVATPSALKRIEALRETEEGEKKLREDLIQKNMKSLEGARIEVSLPANEQGHLFAGLHAQEIVSFIKKQTEIDILPEHLTLSKPVKEVGEHQIEAKAGEASAKFTLAVSKE